MALFHRATLTPTNAELIADGAPTQVWGAGGRPAIGLTATWPGQADPVVLAEVVDVGR